MFFSSSRKLFCVWYRVYLDNECQGFKAEYHTLHVIIKRCVMSTNIYIMRHIRNPIKQHLKWDDEQTDNLN